MSLTMIIVINAALDVAIIGALAFIMSRAARLTPVLALTSGATTPGPRRPASLPRVTRHGRTRPRVGAAFE